LAFDFANAKVYAFDGKDSLLQELAFEIGDKAISPDPHYYNYPDASPYAYCGNNPIMRIDPTGMDWYENESGKVVWNDKVTSADNTPKGGTYIGTQNSDILNYYGFNTNFQSQKSSAYGQVPMGEEGYHFAGAKTTTGLFVNANIDYDENAKSASNISGLVFNGVNVRVNTTTSSTGSTEGDMGVMGGISVKYGNSEFTGGFTQNNEPSISQTGSLNQTATILLPNGSLSKSNTAQSSVLVRGGYGVQGTDGFYRPLVFHALFPIARSFKHNFNINKRK
jgi:hypothetical protein